MHKIKLVAGWGGVSHIQIIESLTGIYGDRHLITIRIKPRNEPGSRVARPLGAQLRAGQDAGFRFDRLGE
jgi:hypothetical protein